MDNPLKPKSVPLSAETVLWFEFLLNPNLLNSHLKKLNPDPSPIELISQFIQMAPENQMIPQYDLTGATNPETEGNIPIQNPPTPTPEGLKMPRKSIALKILTLKIATHIKWNLDIIEKNLPVQKQIHLLKDLCTLSFGKTINIPISEDFAEKTSAEGSENAAKFALTLYHRWVLRLQILKDMALKACRPPAPSLPVPAEPVHPFAPEIPPQPSIDYLKNVVASNEQFHILTYETFIPVLANTEKIVQNYDAMKVISNSEIRAQIYYDLVGYYLFAKDYKAAHDAVIECRRYLLELKLEYKISGDENNFHYCHIEDDELEGVLLACGVSETPVKLTEKLNRSLLNQYEGITDLLKMDNHQREIPLSTRRIIELDIEGAISRGTLKESKDFEMEIAALNVIRSIFEDGNIFSNIDFFEKYKNYDCFSMIINGIQDILLHCNINEKNKIKDFLIDCILKSNNVSGKKFIEQLRTFNELFSQSELDNLTKEITEEEIFVPQLACQDDWKTSSKIPRIEIGNIERQLISCSGANAVRKLLVKLASTNPTRPLWTVNPSWQIPQPINQILSSLQRGFLQDFSYVLMGKAREMAVKSDYYGAISMLTVLKQETQRPDLVNTAAITKLGKLVTWEILLVQITQALEKWNKKSVDQILINKCKQCLNTLQGNENIIPRIEIIEHCTILLLNCNEWNAIMFLEKKLPCVELHVAFASTFLELEKLKGSKKICRDAWDIVLNIFSSGSNKRGNNISAPNTGGNNNSNPQSGNNSARNSPGLQISTSLYPFLKKIRDHPMGYNVRSVSETLNWLLKEALKYYPQNTGWLKLRGDLELSIGNNEAAMRCYINAIITASEYCSLPLQRSVIDDYIVRKMIKCCTNLGCYMQAAVLCQFLDEIDYGLAFKNISEKTSNSDSMDAYYSCIWDSTLLEFIINHHYKKGEHNKKLEAIAVISQLELNANNNEEIKREAATVRKTRFLRALAKQYLY
ncbi:integrator complex subunit 8 isoform X2 [Condylostylus longicornis]|uniref:integrator complex subunit 8 isoform X2 n=1 Tax=Condylostylus longicornis TaxID=2530218 RepID=UPI00244E1F37|nr:integrator complex subunit 8 isoform X2 [Condylostylus longicornis]